MIKLVCWFVGHNWSWPEIAKGEYSWCSRILQICQRCGRIRNNRIEGSFAPRREPASSVVEREINK